VNGGECSGGIVIASCEYGAVEGVYVELNVLRTLKTPSSSVCL